MRIDIDPRLEINDETARRLRRNQLPTSRPEARRRFSGKARVRWFRHRRGRRVKARSSMLVWFAIALVLYLVLHN